MHTDKPRNISRTWKVDLYGSWGDGPSAKVLMGSHIITLSADANGERTAQVDGQEATVQRAEDLLNWAKSEGKYKLLHETLPEESEPLHLPAEPGIGNKRAAILHKIMGMVGLPSAQHYALAAAALGEWVPVPSLAELSEREAKTVWGHLCRLYPRARTYAANLNARAAHAA